MGEMTTIGEILDFAIRRESEAVDFYMAMADRVKDPAIEKFFEDLVAEELEHKSRLELEVMKEGLVAETVGVLPETCLDDAVVDLDRVNAQMGYAEALDLAIRKERLSFRLYAQLSGLIGEVEPRETLLSLAEEEVKHLMAIEDLYREAMTERM
ncbi:MAG: ferritin-like domain-containing protein [Planctomycetota bacterium]